MSATVLEPQRKQAPAAQEASPARRTWSRDEFYQLNETGFFQHQHVELLEGEIILMPTQDFVHAYAMITLYEFILQCLQHQYWVRYQLPLHLGEKNCLEPDISVVAGKPEDYHDHPELALFIAEISSSTLQHDRRTKGSLYARNGVPEYWIVNLAQRQIEIYLNPQADVSAPYGYSYADKQVKGIHEHVALNTLPTKSLEVKKLFRS